MYAADETGSEAAWLYVAVRGTWRVWAELVERHAFIMAGTSFGNRHEAKWRENRDLRRPMLEAIRDSSAEVVAWRLRPGDRHVPTARMKALRGLLMTAGGTGSPALVLLDRRDANQDSKENRTMNAFCHRFPWSGTIPAWAQLHSNRVPALQFADMAAGALGALERNSTDDLGLLIKSSVRSVVDINPK